MNTRCSSGELDDLQAVGRHELARPARRLAARVRLAGQGELVAVVGERARPRLQRHRVDVDARGLRGGGLVGLRVDHQVLVAPLPHAGFARRRPEVHAAVWQAGAGAGAGFAPAPRPCPWSDAASASNSTHAAAARSARPSGARHAQNCRRSGCARLKLLVGRVAQLGYEARRYTAARARVRRFRTDRPHACSICCARLRFGLVGRRGSAVEHSLRHPQGSSRD